mgnify:CR=1 FL=1
MSKSCIIWFWKKRKDTQMNIKATRRRMISCFAQIINDYVLGYKIPELVRHEKIKARKLSYDSQMYLLMLGQFLHVFSLNELVDISKIYAKELSRIRGITSANLNTFSNANRTRNPAVMEKFFWMMYDHFKSQDESFINAKHKGKLSRSYPQGYMYHEFCRPRTICPSTREGRENFSQNLNCCKGNATEECNQLYTSN